MIAAPANRRTINSTDENALFAAFYCSGKCETLDNICVEQLMFIFICGRNTL
jgi:hypothetical protein